MNQGEHTINSMLAPVSVDEFFERYWEQKPLHISRSDSEQFAGLLELHDIESLLSTQQLRFPQVQLTQSGKSLSARDYTDTDNRIIPYRLLQQHMEGATIVISQADTLFATLANLCRHVCSALQLSCQANVYLSAAGNQGFNAHYDTHDVFILQLSGNKSFNFYKPGVKLPIVHDAFNPEFINNLELTETIYLKPGDSLYIPRGMVHDAVAQEDTSLHITLGVFAVVIRDLLTEIIREAAENDAALRASIPRNTWTGQGDKSSGESRNEVLIAMLKDTLLNQTLHEENIATALSSLRDDVAINGAQSCQGLLARNSLPNTLADDTQFNVNKHVILNHERDGSTLKVRAIGKILEFSEPLSAAVEWILIKEQFTAAEVPELGSQQKTALMHRLLSENLVSVAKYPL